MRKGIRLLTALAAALFLLVGCGTQMYELTEEEETLIVQSAAYALSKYNIYQTDGMNGALVPEEETEPADSTPETGALDTQEPDDGTVPGDGSDVSGETSPVSAISLAESIGYKDKLTVSYDGYSLMDVYQEGTYFSLSAEKDHTFLVMRFTLHNETGADIAISNFDKGYAFYCDLAGSGRVPEKQSFIADSLASFEGKVAAGKSAGAVLIFEITKEQAEQVSDPVLTMEHNGTVYLINL